MDTFFTGDTFNPSGNYRIEVSGWEVDNSFFVERTDLLWTANGEKQVELHRALPEGVMVFIRLLAPESSVGSVPVAYLVRDVLPMDSRGRFQMRLEHLHPRSKESLTGKRASNGAEDSQRVCDTKRAEKGLQPEEILQ